jgi:hypothetical protein
MSLHLCRKVRPVFLLLAVASVQAQTSEHQTANSNAQVPTIKTEARAVVVDVVVTQGKEPVVGLHKEDFEVSEDGFAGYAATNAARCLHEFSDDKNDGLDQCLTVGLAKHPGE